MARKKRKFKRQRRGIQVTADAISLVCYECNLTRQFERNGEDTTHILDREAKGWYTIYNGIALCPKHTITSGANLRPLLPLAETIYGDPDARREDLERYMERTRRRMERSSWTSATSDDSTT